MQDTIAGFVCTITNENINIKDSYKVLNKETMNSVLTAIKRKYPDCKVFELRKWNSLIWEWCSHSRMYKLGLWKSHTASVDLDINEPLWRRICYFLIGAW